MGCGVGWGPGFRTEVIGYVGAPCGLGFTLAGGGIGVPANCIFQAPYNGWNSSAAPCLAGLQREAGKSNTS
ncbi:Cadmium-induced protein AS8 [Linum grandiflorum]